MDADVARRERERVCVCVCALLLDLSSKHNQRVEIRVAGIHGCHEYASLIIITTLTPAERLQAWRAPSCAEPLFLPLHCILNSVADHHQSCLVRDRRWALEHR